MRASRMRNRRAATGGTATLVFTAGTPYQATASVTASDPVALPTGLASGDYTLLVCALNGSTGTITPPSGWSAVLASTQATVSTSAVHAIYYRQWVSGDTAPVVTCTSGRLAVLPVRVQGASASFIEVAASVTQQGAAGTTIVAPTVTSTASNVMCVTFMGRSSTNGVTPTFTPPSGTTEIGEASGQAAAATNAAVSFNTSAITAGVASGTRTGTASATITGGMGVSFVLQRG